MTSLFKGVTFEAEIKNLALHDARGEKAPKEVLVRVTNQFSNKVSNFACSAGDAPNIVQ